MESRLLTLLFYNDALMSIILLGILTYSTCHMETLDWSGNLTINLIRS